MWPCTTNKYTQGAESWKWLSFGPFLDAFFFFFLVSEGAGGTCSV